MLQFAIKINQLVDYLADNLLCKVCYLHINFCKYVKFFPFFRCLRLHKFNFSSDNIAL